MFLLSGVQIYLARQPVDLRKSIDGLSLLVSQGLGQGPFSARPFVFVNRRRDKLKALSWDQNGFVLYYKRLERGHFRWPFIPADHPLYVEILDAANAIFTGWPFGSQQQYHGKEPLEEPHRHTEVHSILDNYLGKLIISLWHPYR